MTSSPSQPRTCMKTSSVLEMQHFLGYQIKMKRTELNYIHIHARVSSRFRWCTPWNDYIHIILHWYRWMVESVSCAYLWCSPLQWNHSSMGNIVLTVLKISGHSKVCNLYTHAMNNKPYSLHTFNSRHIRHMTTPYNYTNSSSYMHWAMWSTILHAPTHSKSNWIHSIVRLQIVDFYFL